jgi:hypothetical protein
MKCFLRSIFLALALMPDCAFAETYRCVMGHEIAVGNNGLFEENKEANKGKEFFIALDKQKNSGIVSSCSNDHCFNENQIHTIIRFETGGTDPAIMIRMVSGSDGQLGQLWSLHGSKNSGDYTVVAVFAMAQRSDTTFGTCRLIIQ